MDGLLGRHPGRGAKRPDPGLGPHAAAEGLAIQQACPQPVEEAQIHRPAGEEAVRARVVQGQDGLGPVGGMDHSPQEYLEVASIVPRTALLAGLIAAIGRDPEVGAWRRERQERPGAAP